MKKHFVFLSVLAALLIIAGSRPARAYTEPRVTWDPQSLSYPVGADAEYSATFSGENLEFTWFVEYGGTDYSIPDQKTQLMNAGLKSYCDDVTVTSSANRTTITFKNIKMGIDGSPGKWTRVYCNAYDGNTGALSSHAHVSCNGFGVTDAGYPPMIYVKPVINLKADDVGKIGVRVLDVDYYYVDDVTYQWYHYKGGTYDKALQAIPGEDGSIYISDTAPGGYEDLVVGVFFHLKNGSDYSCYSSPINVNRLKDTVDYSYDQLRIVKTPDRTGYELGDKVDLTGLQVEYIAGGKSQGIVPISSLTTDITNFLYAGPVWVNVSYKGETNGFTVWVEPKAGVWECEAPTSAEATTAEATTAEVTTAEAATSEATTAEATTAEAPVQPDTTEAPAPSETESAQAQPETTEAPTQPESTPSGTKEEPAATSSAAAPVQTTEAAPNGGSSGGTNTVLIILIILMACVIGLLSGILIGRKKK